MTRAHYHFVDAVTGIGTGHSAFDTLEGVERNLPNGAVAWAADAFDYLCERVDIGKGCVVPYQPPAPADTDLATWDWDVDTRRWVAAPTLLALQQQARRPVLEQLRQLDGKAARPVGEIAEAQALGETVPTAAVQRLTAINADKAALRVLLATLASAVSVAELDAALGSAPALQTLDT